MNHVKNMKQSFSQGKFNSSTLYFPPLYPHYIYILFIHCILLSNEILLSPKLQDAKDASHFLHKNFGLQRAKSLVTLDVYIAKWISNDNSNAALKSVGFPMHAEVWNLNAKHFYSNASFSLKTGSYVANTKTIKICFVIFQEDFTHQCFLTLVPRLLCCFYII